MPFKTKRLVALVLKVMPLAPLGEKVVAPFELKAWPEAMVAPPLKVAKPATV